MVLIPSRVDVTSPRSLASTDFNVQRRGFDRDEVRALLEQVAAELQRLQDENARLTDELAAARSGDGAPLDEAMVAGLLGAEAARVLSTAREAATEMRTNAEQDADQLRHDARDEAATLREEAALDAHRQRQDALAEAQVDIEAAKAEGRQMVAEARAVRERMLSDLARRRDAARLQLMRLREDRDRLVASFLESGRSVDAVLEALREAAPEPPEIETVEAAVAAVAEEAAPDGPIGDETDDREAVEAPGAEVAQVAAPVEPEAAVAFHLGEEPASAPGLTYAGELEPTDDARSSVDDLFAKLRTGGPAEVANAVASGTDADAAAAAAAQADGATPAPDAATDVEEAAADDVDDVNTAYLAPRAEALDPLQSSVARQLKRALTDEQNEVLDRLRRAKMPDGLDDFVGDVATHAERYRGALLPDLRSAVAAGAASVGVSRDLPSSTVQDAVLDEVTAEFVVPLRLRLTKALEDADGDTVEAGATMRAAYREWRTHRADEIAADLVLTAHGRGAYDAVDDGTPLRWVVDPEGPLCPDADDNALGGVVCAGEAFPTGHRHAPAHPGCRCGITVTQG